MPPKRNLRKQAIQEHSEESDNEEIEIDLENMNTKDIVKAIYKKLKGYEAMKLEIQDLKETVVRNSRDIEKLKKTLQDKDKENKTLKSHLEKQEINMIELNQRSRMLNIVVNGIPESPNENVTEIVTNLGTKIGITDASTHIQVAHRITSKSDVKPIVVRLLNTKTRDIWVKAAKEMKLREEKIFISEHLTVQNYQLLLNVKQWARDNRHRFVWTQDCRILIRKEEKSRVKCVKSMKDLDPKWSQIKSRPFTDELDSE